MIRNIICYFLCLLLFFLLGYLNNKQTYILHLKQNYRQIMLGLILQITVLFMCFNIPAVINCLCHISEFILKIKESTLEGTKFVFGYLGGGKLPFITENASNTFIFAFQALPTIITVSVISALLTYFKIIPILSKILGSVFKWTFGISKDIGMVAVSKVFLGQLEAPILIKSQLNYLNRRNTFIILTLAFTTSAASVMPIYSDVLQQICPNAMNHLVISNLLNVINTVLVSVIIFPKEKDELCNIATERKQYQNFADAISQGISSGACAWWGVVGSLIGIVSLVSFINYILGNVSSLTLQKIVAWMIYPVSWLLEISSQEIHKFSEILGTRIVMNETIAFFDLAKSQLSSNTIIKAIYTINNFGNLACIGITLGGILSLAPKQQYILQLIGKAFLTGLIITISTTALVSLFL